jgi:DNA segregation ATPase FtsK/SpoIIIE, S-DNA-T family
MTNEMNALGEAIKLLKLQWRHRPTVTIPGTTFNLTEEQKIPALILDTIDAIWADEKKPRPQLIRQGIKKMMNGWIVILHLHPGVSYSDIEKRQEHFEASTGCNITIERDGQHVKIVARETQGKVVYPYEWDPYSQPKLHLPIPMGYSFGELVVLDLIEGPHVLVAGETGGGKTNIVRVITHSLIPHAKVAIIDMKGLDFTYLGESALLVDTIEEAQKLLSWLNKEMDRRKAILKSLKLSKIQKYKGDDMPYIVCIIDELAEIDDEDIIADLDRLARLARALGIHLIACTQHPSVEVLPGKTRAQFPVRVCFAVATEGVSRMILGDKVSDAARLMGKGQAIMKHGRDIKQIQTMLLEPEEAEQLIKDAPKGGWDIEREAKRLLP